MSRATPWLIAVAILVFVAFAAVLEHRSKKGESCAQWQPTVVGKTSVPICTKWEKR